jgi:type IV secretory pathway VirB10-like protein
VNLSTRAAKCDEETGDPVHALGDALLTSPSAGHLLRGLANAVCDKWPIMSVDEMPPVQCLPPPDPPERAARRQRKETRRKERETKRNKRPRRDTWKEKTPKEKAKERRREAKRLARKNREKAAAGGRRVRG